MDTAEQAHDDVVTGSPRYDVPIALVSLLDTGATVVQGQSGRLTNAHS
jgi:hypothetical protein